jgi:hypothetical protein
MVMPHHLLGAEPPSFEPARFSPHGSPTAMPLFELALGDGETTACTSSAAKAPRP